MPIELKPFNGILNSDDSAEVLPNGQHVMARNGVFRGTGKNLRFENILGTNEISYSKPSGASSCIAAYYDAKKLRVFFAIYNSNTGNGWFILDTKTNAVTPLIISNINTNGDILGFTLTRNIYNVNIIYGDSTQGDVLYWLDSLKRPCQINIDQQLAGSYGIVQRSFIDVAKEPATSQPQVLFEDDTSVTVNNLRKKLFVFKTRLVFNNGDKSVWSAHSIVALPVNSVDTNVDTDPTKNARIAIVVQTGAANVKKIEIAAAESLGTLFSDFYLIKVVNKATENVNDNDIYTYRFYNDQAYTYIDLTESVQEFDWTPQTAEAQELLNGNTIAYGGCKEGYDLITMSATSSVGADIETSLNFSHVLFDVAQQGESGFQTGNIHIVCIGSPKTGDVYNIYTTNFTVTFTVGATQTTAAVLSGLAASATGNGFTLGTFTSENLVIVKSGESLLRFNTSLAGSLNINTFYDWNSRYGFGIVYFDDKGRTNGVIYSSGMTAQTPVYAEDMSGEPLFPYINLSISSRPPIWATYYQIVRTKNLSKSKFIYWITSQTFKDDLYAYLSIADLNQFIKDNPSAAFLQYDFATNDRVRLVKLYPSGGLSTNQVYGDKDFTIVASVDNPIINGIQYTGQFIKINLPTTYTLFDFGIQSPLGVPIDYSHYLIQLYTPAQSVANGLEFYYEFGEKYAIGNAGTVNAFHQGMLQNQTSNLATPATFKLIRGDDYARERIYNAGNELKYTLIAGDLNSAVATPNNHVLGATLSSNTYNAAGYTAKSSEIQFIGSSTLSDSGNWIINETDGNARTFNIKGQIVIQALDNSSDAFDLIIDATNGGAVSTTFLFTSSSIIAANDIITANIDTSFTIPAGSNKTYLGYSTNDTNFDARVIGGSLTITEPANIFSQYIIDPNFSDFFQSSVNSNGRAWIFDENAKQITFGNLIRFGLPYEIDTNINQTNRFYGTNFVETDASRGDILRFKTRGQEFRIFLTRGVGRTGIYAKYIQDNSGGSSLVTTDEILTRNNIDYYLGEHGLGTQPTSLISSANTDYFIDPVTGDHIRLPKDGGMISLNQSYWGKYYIRSLLTPYNKTNNRNDGSIAKIFGCFYPTESQCIVCLQGGFSKPADILSGLNGNMSSSARSFSNTEVQNAIISLGGVQIMRYPGGNVANSFNWHTGKDDDGTGAANTLDDIAALHQNVGCDILFVLNMLTKSLPDQLAMLAAANSKGIPIKYIELGNEFNNVNNPGHITFPTPASYATTAATWMTAIKGVYPNCKVAFIGGNRTWSGGSVWNSTMLAQNPDALTWHTSPNIPTFWDGSVVNYDAIAQGINSDWISDGCDLVTTVPIWPTETNYTYDPNNLLPDDVAQSVTLYIAQQIPKYIEINSGLKVMCIRGVEGAKEGAFLITDADIIILPTGLAFKQWINEDILSPNTFSFNEQRNGYDTFYDFNPEMILCAGTIIYSWLNGNLFAHNNINSYTNFYGQQFYPSINLLFNDKEAVRKTYNALAYQGNQFWEAPTDGDIYTSLIGAETNLRQTSQLNALDFEINEGLYYAAFLRDANSGVPDALLEGDVLKGEYMSVKLTYRGNRSAFLYAPYITWSASNRNF